MVFLFGPLFINVGWEVLPALIACVIGVCAIQVGVVVFDDCVLLVNIDGAFADHADRRCSNLVAHVSSPAGG
jgi:hypothetical protein